MDKKSIDKIKKELKKSGVPLEVKILKMASCKPCGRMPNYRYLLNDEIKEIDLHIQFEDYKLTGRQNWLPCNINSLISIECKKSERYPWVFYRVDEYFGSPEYDYLNYLQYYSTLDDYLKREEKQSFLSKIEENLTYHHYSNPATHKCINYLEAGKKTGNPSEIYKACQSAVNYIRYQKNSYKRALENAEEKGLHRNVFFYPVIVFDGQLMVAKMDENTIDLSETPYLMLRTFLEDQIYIIDVVREDYFQTYLDIVEKSHNSMKKALFSLKFDNRFSRKCRDDYRNFKFKPPIDFPISYFIRTPIKGGKRRLNRKNKEEKDQFLSKL